MKNLLALIGLTVVLVGGGGWYLGWYKLGTEADNTGHTKINVDVNRDKITQDVKAGEKKIETFLNKDQVPTSAQIEKKVEGTTTGLQLNPDGTWSVVLPKLEFKK